VKSGFASEAPPLSATLGELRKDIEFLDSERHAHEQ
jgi:hypothetical protein